MVMVEVPPGATGPVPVIVEFVGDATCVKMTVPPANEIGVDSVNVFVSALVDFKVQVEIPDAFVVEHAPYEFVVPVLVAVKLGFTPTMGELEKSISVMVMVELEVPSAPTGLLPVMDE